MRISVNLVCYVALGPRYARLASRSSLFFTSYFVVVDESLVRNPDKRRGRKQKISCRHLNEHFVTYSVVFTEFAVFMYWTLFVSFLSVALVVPATLYLIV
jgi:hypothetical protein